MRIRNATRSVSPAVRTQIVDLIGRYAHGVDRKDWELVRSCYHPDAYDNHGAYQGGVDGLIEWLVRRHSAISSSMHFLTNFSVRCDSQFDAVCETYCFVVQVIEGAESEALRMYGIAGSESSTVELETRCRFIDRLSHRDHSWRISRRDVIFEAVRYKSVESAGRFGADWTVATRTPSDLGWPLFTG